jgi:hypothetical protein
VHGQVHRTGKFGNPAGIQNQNNQKKPVHEKAQITEFLKDDELIRQLFTNICYRIQLQFGSGRERERSCSRKGADLPYLRIFGRSAHFRSVRGKKPT